MTDLQFVFGGWEGYNQSLKSAIDGLTWDELQFRPIAQMRSVGELVWHIGDGRIDWFRRIVPELCQSFQ